MTALSVVERFHLGSGVPVNVVVAPSAHVATIACCIRRSARHEPDAASGVTHLLEHLMLRTGTPAAFSLPREIERLGGEVNALTSNEELFVYCRVAPEHAVRVTSLLMRSVCDEALPMDSFETERRVVLEEIQGALGDPAEHAHEVLYDTIFAGHPLGRPVSGTLASVKRLTPDDVLDWRRRALTGSTAGSWPSSPPALKSCATRSRRAL